MAGDDAREFTHTLTNLLPFCFHPQFPMELITLGRQRYFALYWQRG